MKLPIDTIQGYLKKHGLDGWLMVDFHSRNDIAVQMLGLPTTLTRRFCYFIPSSGSPTALVHNIEKAKFSALQGTIIPFSSYRLLESELQKLLVDCKKIAMEYAPHGRLPYIGLVDAGTIELIRSFGCEIVTSADLVAFFQARLSVEQIATHRIAAKNLIEIKSLNTNKKQTEFDIMNYMLAQFEEYDMINDHGPNCSINQNAGNPHYEPTAENAQIIKRGDLILLDIWAKLKIDNAVMADITWMAFAGRKSEIPPKYNELFSVLAHARDAAIQFLRDNIDKRQVFGYEVDDACRNVVIAAGYDKYFTHRTGHSITTSTHGTGPNIDNLETEDRRVLQQGHLFSVEPGIYMADCGFRTEIDVLISNEGVEITTLPLQTEIVTLF